MTPILHYFLIYIYALSELLACCCYLRPFEKRFESRPQRLALVLLGALGIALMSASSRTNLFFAWYSLGYTAIMTAFIYLYADCGRRNAFYHAILFTMASHCIMHLVAEVLVRNFDALWFVEGESAALRLLSIAGLFLLRLLALPSLRRRRQNLHARIPNKRIALISISALLMVALSDIKVRLMMNAQGSSWLISCLLLYEVICGFVGIISALITDSMLLEYERAAEAERMEAFMQIQRQQYEQKQEAANRISRQYHDLKNHLDYIKNVKSREDRERYIRKLEEDLQNYERFRSTGNEALDTILHQKLTDCMEKGIDLLLLVDGKLVDFMEPMDIVTVFGNAIDNAMEATQALPEGVRREILVRSTLSGGLTVLHFENRFQGPIREEKGRLLSTKATASEHGVGLASIEYAIQKYGGHLSFSFDGGLFSLNLLLKSG